MTKYILAGGNDRISGGEFGVRLAREVRKGHKGHLRILSSFFADPLPWQWDLRYRNWDPWFKKNFGDDIGYDLARPDTFLQQIGSSDLVYLHGGDNDTILTNLERYPDLEAAFRDKIIVGSSAGANFLSEQFWTRSKRQVRHGSGIVPVSVMVHYGSKDGGFNDDIPIDWGEADTRMEAATGSKPIFRIKEGEFVVIEQ